jgi:hypothetical protein
MVKATADRMSAHQATRGEIGLQQERKGGRAAIRDGLRYTVLTKVMPVHGCTT